jgi:hypothetical protein
LLKFGQNSLNGTDCHITCLSPQREKIRSEIANPCNKGLSFQPNHRVFSRQISSEKTVKKQFEEKLLIKRGKLSEFK